MLVFCFKSKLKNNTTNNTSTNKVLTKKQLPWLKANIVLKFFLNINNREMSVYFYIQRVFKIRNSEEKKSA